MGQVRVGHNAASGGTVHPLGSGLDTLDRRIASSNLPAYRLIGKAGAGGMGRVYRAIQLSLNRPVVVKFLDPRMTSQSLFRDLFLKEIDLLKALKHPGIVAIFDAGEVDGLPYYVMESVEGVTLRKLMAVGDLTPAQVVKLIMKICEPLEAAHAAGVVHRDLKPENVFVCRRGAVKVMDFGVAAVQTDSGRIVAEAQGFYGTTLYAAPEQRAGRAADPRADVYSLGVIMYEMLTLARPPDGSPPPLTEVSPQTPKWLSDIVAKALSVDPSRRYASAEELLAALSAAQFNARATIVRSTAEETLIRQIIRDLYFPYLGWREITSRVMGLLAGLALIVTIFTPTLAKFPNVLHVDRYVRSLSGEMAVPMSALIAAAACLSLGTSLLRPPGWRGLIQLAITIGFVVVVDPVLPLRWWAAVLSWDWLLANTGLGFYTAFAAGLMLWVGAAVSSFRVAKWSFPLAIAVLTAILIWRHCL